MADKAKTKTRRIIACALAVLLVAGLVPTLPENPYALAQEPDTVVNLDTGEDFAVIENSDTTGGQDGDEKGSSQVTGLELLQESEDSDEHVLEAQSTSIGSRNIEVGDKITLGRYQGQVITWVCVAINEHGPLMLSEKILCNKAFDANGNDSNYHSDGWGYIRKGYGSNCWRDSNLRQWLNTTGTVNWSHCAPTSQRVKDGLNAYNAETGFLTEFTEDELASIKSVNRIVNVNSWETSREGYVDGGSSKITYGTIASCNLSSEQRQKYFYQRIEDRIFLLGPDELYAAWQNASDILLQERNQWWLGIAQNTGASFENISTFDPATNSTSSATGAARAYDGSVCVRPAFYLSDKYSSGYNSTRDKYAFRNFETDIPLSYFIPVFHPAPALILWAKFGHAGGVCYGLANSTYSLLSRCPNLVDVKNIYENEEGNYSIDDVDDISSIEYNKYTKLSPTYVRAGIRGVPFIDFVRYNHIFQFSPYSMIGEIGSKNNIQKIFKDVKREVDTGISGSILRFVKRESNGERFDHVVYAVGYSESATTKKIFVDDSNVTEGLCSITIDNDWNWTYDADEMLMGTIFADLMPSLDSSNCDLSKKPASVLPYAICSFIWSDSSWNWLLWGNWNQLLGDAGGQVYEDAPYEDGSLLVGVAADDYEIKSDGLTPIEENKADGTQTGGGLYGDLFWAPVESLVKVASLKSNNDRVMVAEGTHIVTASASDESSINLEKTSVGTKTTVESSDGAIVTVEVEDVISDTSISTLSVVGTAASGTSSMDTIDNGYLVDGLQDVTLTLTNDNGSTDERVVANEEGHTLEVCVDESDAEISVTPVPAFRTQSLTLGGTIGVNFYADLSPLADEEREGCKATFSVNGRIYEDGYDADFKNSKGYYGFTCPVTSVEMADEITATLSWGDGKSITKTYSVAGYMETFEQYASTFDEETRALVRSVADYGHYVQPFLARERDWEIGKDHKEMPAASTWAGTEAEWKGTEADEAESASAGYAIVRDLPEGCGFAVPTQSLVLDSGTDLCLYATCEDGVSLTGAALADGTKLACECMPDGRWRITIPGIKAHELGKNWEVRISSSTGATGTVRTSALAWVRSALAYDDWKTDRVARDAAASIWRYAKAADVYRAAHPQG